MVFDEKTDGPEILRLRKKLLEEQRGIGDDDLHGEDYEGDKASVDLEEDDDEESDYN